METIRCGEKRYCRLTYKSVVITEKKKITTSHPFNDDKYINNKSGLQ